MTNASLSAADSWNLRFNPGLKEEEATTPNISDDEGNTDNIQDTSQNAPEMDSTSTEDTQTENPDQSPKDPSKSDDFHDWKKRYSDLKSHHDKSLNDKEKEISELKKAVSEATQTPLPSTDEELENFSKSNPQLYNLVTSMLEKKARETNQVLREKLTENEKLIQRIQNQDGFKELLNIHPDVVEIRESPEFLSWVDKQSSTVKNMLEDTGTVEDIAFAIEKYKKDTGKSGDSSKQSKKDKAVESTAANPAASKPTHTKDKKVWKMSEIHKLSAADYERVEKEIDKAMEDKRIINDLAEHGIY